MNKSAHRYTKEQMQHMKSELRDHIYYFGYTQKPDSEEIDTPFFEYRGEDGDLSHDMELLEKRYQGYLAQNEDSMQAVI